jgi:hypothetical protein
MGGKKGEGIMGKRGDDARACLIHSLYHLRNERLDYWDPNIFLTAIWKTGVTTFCPTLITSSTEPLERNFRVLEKVRRLDAHFASSALCYHLEGPYLSPGGAHGAHDPALMRSPDWNEFSRFQEAAGGNVAIVENIEVRFRIPAQEKVKQISAFTPNANDIRSLQMITRNGKIGFTLPRLGTYSLAEIS